MIKKAQKTLNFEPIKPSQKLTKIVEEGNTSTKATKNLNSQLTKKQRAFGPFLNPVCKTIEEEPEYRKSGANHEENLPG